MGKEFKMNNDSAQVSIKPEDLKDVLCDKCENQTFIQVSMFKKISAILSPNGQESMIPIQVYKCDECGHINEAFLPKSPSGGLA